MAVDHDLVVFRELHGSVKPFRVRQEANLYEDPVEVDLVISLVCTAPIGQRSDLLVVAEHLGGHGASDDRDVGEAA